MRGWFRRGMSGRSFRGGLIQDRLYCYGGITIAVVEDAESIEEIALDVLGKVILWTLNIRSGGRSLCRRKRRGDGQCQKGDSP
jgi:hypothetical protein